MPLFLSCAWDGEDADQKLSAFFHLGWSFWIENCPSCFNDWLPLVWCFVIKKLHSFCYKFPACCGLFGISLSMEMVQGIDWPPKLGAPEFDSEGGERTRWLIIIFAFVVASLLLWTKCWTWHLTVVFVCRRASLHWENKVTLLLLSSQSSGFGPYLFQELMVNLSPSIANQQSIQPLLNHSPVFLISFLMH